MSAFTSGDELVHYEVLGRGRPLILVHGWVGSWRYWIPTMQALQMSFRTYALDLLGFGDSFKNARRYSIEHQVALIDDFMRELGISKAALFGHGLGALIAAEFARRYPERVPRLLLSSAPLFDPGDLNHRVPAGRQALRPITPQGDNFEQFSSNAPTQLSAGAAMRAALLEAAKAKAASGQLAPELADKAMAAAVPTFNPLRESIGALTPETLLSRCFRRGEPNFEKLSVDIPKIDPEALRRSIETFDAGRMLDMLRLLPMPTLIVHGTDDPIIPAPSEEILHYITADKEHLLVPILLNGVRHYPMIEDERFIRLANDFLEISEISRLEIKERWRRRTR